MNRRNFITRITALAAALGFGGTAVAEKKWATPSGLPEIGSPWPGCSCGRDECCYGIPVERWRFDGTKETGDGLASLRFTFLPEGTK